MTLKMYKRRKIAQPSEHEEIPDDDGILATLPDDSLVPPRAATRFLPHSTKTGIGHDPSLAVLFVSCPPLLLPAKRA